MVANLYSRIIRGSIRSRYVPKRVECANFMLSSSRSFANREPLLPKSIVQNSTVKKSLPTLGNISYGALASGFLLQDMLYLRSVVALAYCGIASFHALQERPLRIPFAWSALFAGINIFFAGCLWKEQFIWLGEEEQHIYDQHFSSVMSTADFEQLIQVGQFASAEEKLDVIKKGQIANIVLVISGSAEVTVGEGVVVVVQRPGLLGESSYLRGSVATKTVSVLPGSRYVVWERSALKTLEQRKPSVQKALELMMGRELSRKLGETSNRLIEASSGVKYVAMHQQIIEYEGVVLRYTLRLLAEEHLFATSHCRLLFDSLAQYRKKEEVPLEVHRRTMEKLGIDEDACIGEGRPLRAVCCQVADSQIPQSRVRVRSTTIQ